MRDKIIDKVKLIENVRKNTRYLIWAFICFSILFIIASVYTAYITVSTAIINDVKSDMIPLCLTISSILLYVVYKVYTRLREYVLLHVAILDSDDCNDPNELDSFVTIFSKIYFILPELKRHIKDKK